MPATAGWGRIKSQNDLYRVRCRASLTGGLPCFSCPRLPSPFPRPACLLHLSQGGRARGREPEGVFHARLYPLLPALFVLVLVGVAMRVLVAETRMALVGLLLMLAGAPLFALGRRATRHA